ncbi:HsmA family protein [Helicovermis profundi]|uniref:HsmA family protein n=1 Tax=Helicovermis profundi TaxID=3065157 RepID=A0AAU9EPH7_9FIRM|nr:HsmA family protein [Clostridia bacterium S502]
MLLIIAIISMLFAVTAYTIGVFSERRAKTLNNKHVIMFWIGLFFDTLGTTTMSIISGKITFNLHGVTGLLAIVLMMLHVIWATFINRKGSEKQKVKFHKYSLFVWLIWLVPFVTGMILNM